MGRYVEQNQSRSKLQQRIAADLRAKALASSRDDAAVTNAVNDSHYMQSTKQTTQLAWVWLAVCLLVVAGMIWFVIMTFNQNAAAPPVRF